MNTDQQLTKGLSRFRALEVARGFSSHSVKAAWIVEFDGFFWVGSPADCARLVKAGGRFVY